MSASPESSELQFFRITNEPLEQKLIWHIITGQVLLIWTFALFQVLGLMILLSLSQQSAQLATAVSVCTHVHSWNAVLCT